MQTDLELRVNPCGWPACVRVWCRLAAEGAQPRRKGGGVAMVRLDSRVILLPKPCQVVPNPAESTLVVVDGIPDEPCKSGLSRAPLIRSGGERSIH
jgi:hypothetical protein